MDTPPKKLPTWADLDGDTLRRVLEICERKYRAPDNGEIIRGFEGPGEASQLARMIGANDVVQDIRAALEKGPR